MECLTIPRLQTIGHASSSNLVWNNLQSVPILFNSQVPMIFHLVINNHMFISNNPIPVEVVFDEHDGYIASETLFNVFGNGSTIDESLADYKQSIMEYYDLLDQSRLINPFDSIPFQKLNFYIRKIS